MAKLTKILRSNDPVSETAANAVFELLVPVVEAAPDADAAVEAARGVISRCSLSDDRLLAHFLDWWYVATTGQPSANGGAHRLPDSLNSSVRAPMEAVNHLGTNMSAAKWIYKRRQLDSDLTHVEEILRLDTYGAVKLPGERESWSWLTGQLDSVAAALTENRGAVTVDIDWRKFDQQLRESGIDAGSHRHREMRKRSRRAVDRLYSILSLQHEVEPWIKRQAPGPVSEVPNEVKHAVGPLAEALLRPILAANAAPDIDRVAVVEGLEDAGRGGDKRGRYRLARVIEAWCEETGLEVSSVDAELKRHGRLEAALEELDRKPSVPGEEVDDIRLCVLDDDIDAAEAALERLREKVSRNERAEVARQQFEGLRRKHLESSLSEDAAWQGRVADVEARLATDDPHELAREIGAALTELTTRLDEMLQEQQEDLRQAAASLKILGATDSLVRERESEIAALERRGGRGASEIKQRIEENLRQQREECRASVEQRIGQVDRILTDERSDFSDEDIGDFANRRSEIETLIHGAEISDAELADVGERAEELLKEIEDQRIHQWQAEQGERTLLDHLIRYCKGALDFRSQDIRRLYVSLKTRPFVILAGLTGSGKSSLTRTFAHALGASTANGRFRRVAVRPDWIDQSEVLGYVNPVSNKFIPGWLSETVRDCEHDSDRLHFVLLDEMNLAPVEQYLAEWLSALEEERSGGEGVRLPLYSPSLTPENAEEWPDSLRLPKNLIIVGTVNVDETTRPLSERVLDRANVLLLSIDVSESHHQANGQAPAPWHVGVSEWRKVCAEAPSDAHHEFLVDVAATLRQASVGVGLRAHVELERFLANADGILDPVAALDWGIVQRIIPKIRGFKGHLTDTLNELLEEFERVGAEQSASIVRRWLDDRVSDDEFLDGTDPKLALARI